MMKVILLVHPRERKYTYCKNRKSINDVGPFGCFSKLCYFPVQWRELMHRSVGVRNKGKLL